MLISNSKRIRMGTQQFLNPRPVVLIGTFLDGKPNFITVSWCGITGAKPPTMSIAIRNVRYSLKGIQLNKTFSVNIPSASMVEETDYCGNVSGIDHDKVKECKFEIFNGNLKNAPLIAQCPVNIECKVLNEIILGDHTLILGEIIETYIKEDRFTNDIPDINKIAPLCFCAFGQKATGYYKVGEFIASTKSVDKDKK